MPSQHVRFVSNVREAIGDPQLVTLLRDVTGKFGERRFQSAQAIPEWESLRERASQIKAQVIANLDGYLLQFEDAIVRHGGQVHWASTGEEASKAVLDIARRRGISRVVKSKSMVSEEIEVNRILESAGIAVVESDLGEYILQIAGEPPSHIIAPAIHKSRAQVGRLLESTLGLPFTQDVDAFTAVVRAHLREQFRDAGMGLSGANFGVADTGTIVIVENEGNARMTVSVPRVHVVVMGIEKLVPRAEDLSTFLTLLPRSATGQPMTSYVSMITGPRRPDELDGPEEVHVILLDNGRSSMVQDEILRDALKCIRCGACLNVCPVYQNIGGHAYGGVYAGPIGAIVSSSIDAARVGPDLPFASTLCGACADVCPVKIPIPHILLHLRHRNMEGAPLGERSSGRRRQWLLMKAWAWTMGGPRRYRAVSHLVRWTVRRFLRNGRLSGRPGPLRPWTDYRELPQPAVRTFQEMYEARISRK
jgi:L-lactate dehydrogenase complex protein LldF